MKKRNNKLFGVVIMVGLLGLGGYLWLRGKPEIRKEQVGVPVVNCPDCNVVLITLTNLRYDHVSSNGYSRKTTPNIDALSKEGIIFDNAFSHASWTLPESMSIYTSLYPFQHGVMNRYDGSALSKETPTIIDVLKKSGYLTAAFTGGFDYDPAYGLTDRFDYHDECSKGEIETYPRQESRVPGGVYNYGELSCAAPLAIDWLKQNSKKKFFLHVQGFDAHCPFSQNGGEMFDPGYDGEVDFSSCLTTLTKNEPKMDEGERKYVAGTMKDNRKETVWLTNRDIKHLVALYDESIFTADAEVGKIIDELKTQGVWDKTIVIVTSEHGDNFGKYGIFMRGGPSKGTFYDDVLHIPLVIKTPGVNAIRVKELVAQVDLMPTILGLLNVVAPEKIEGQNIMQVVATGQPAHEYVYAGSRYMPGTMFLDKGGITKVEVVRGLDWKLMRETFYEPVSRVGFPVGGEWLSNMNKEENLKIQRVDTELFQVSKDPEELTDLTNREPKMLKKMMELLDNWSRKINEKK